MKNTFIRPDGFVGRLRRRKRSYTAILLMRISYLNIVFLICGLNLLMASPGNGQEIENTNVELEFHHASLKSVFDEIERQTNFLFIVPPERIDIYTEVDLPKNTYTVKKALDLVLKETGLKFKQEKNYVLVFLAEENARKMHDIDENEISKSEKQVLFATVTGVVKDADTNEPLTGVNIIVKGTTKGATTNAEGKFAIDVEDGDVLLFTFIGFKTFETQVGGRSVIEVTMETDIKTLQEVVVNAGYYNVKEREKTGSISKVSAEVISKQPVTNPLGALSGRMPGVFVQQTSGIPGGDFKIEIRGRNSLRSLSTQGNVIDGNEPLYIVDGVPFSSQKVSNIENSQDFSPNGFGGGGISPLTSINPADIESIEVLKDADATAIYGSRGANGVILITTKKGKVGKTKFEFTAYTGSGRTSVIKMLNTQQYLSIRREGLVSNELTPSSNPLDQGYAPDLTIWDTTRYTNWPEYSMGGAAVTTNIQGSVTGGNELTQFLLTVGYRKEGSVLLSDPCYQKGSSHLSVNHQSLNKKFSINISVSGTLDRNNQTAVDPSSMVDLAPNSPSLYDENGNLNWENSTWENPLANLNGKYAGRTGSIISNAVIGYNILPGLKIKSSFGLTSLGSKELTTIPSTVKNPTLGYTSLNYSYVTKGSGSTLSWIIEPQANWEKKIAKGQLSLLVGSSFQEQHHDRSSTFYKGFPSNSMLHNLNAAAQIYSGIYGTESLYRYAALFGRLNFNWNEKYIINITARRDGSSRFGPGKQFTNFGAVGAAWIFTNESFFKNNISFLSFGKLRTSYGTTGSDQIGDYQYLDSYSTSTLGSTYYQGIAGLTLTKLYNPDFAWEINQKLEGAMELGFFRDRILLNVSYYQNRSSNQLVNYTLPMTTGFTGILANFPATVQNSGIEIELTTLNVQSEKFRWTTSFNVTVPRNKLLEFPNIESSTYANTYTVGKSIYIRKSFESTGVDPQTGLYTFKDFDGDNAITGADRKKSVFIGYDFYGGVNNSLTYNNWRADIFFQFVKQTGYNYRYSLGSIGSRRNQPAYTLEEKRWRKPGDIATIQRMEIATDAEAVSAFNRFLQISDAIISDASFIRLKTISLSYQIPEKWSKSIICSVYIQGQNLFVISKYKGLDPETQPSKLGPLKIVTAGIQLSF